MTIPWSEGLPRSLAPWLTAAGPSAEDVRDRGLRGQPDDDVFRHAVAHGFAVVSGDLGFGTTREDDGAVIAYKDRTVRTTHFRLGPEVHRMTDREILDRFNAGIRATAALAADYQHVAVEVPPGRPQIAYFSRGDFPPAPSGPPEHGVGGVLPGHTSDTLLALLRPGPATPWPFASSSRTALTSPTGLRAPGREDHGGGPDLGNAVRVVA